MSKNDRYHMYVYNIPYAERKVLCRILDINNAWEELGGEHFNFDVGTLNTVAQAVLRSRSPTDELLSLWGTKNHTVHELFGHLARMQHHQAMTAIKNLVDPKYHSLIYQGEENFSHILADENLSPRKNRNHGFTPETHLAYGGKDVKIGEENLNTHKKQELCLNKLERREEKESNTQMPHSPNPHGGQPSRKTSDQSNATIAEHSSPSINYTELERATNGWPRDQLLGKGGFGSVYKGIWKNTHVAIKRLEAQKNDLVDTWKTHREQLLLELKCLNSIRHDNVLPLYGFSIDGPHDCLVYQYMQNGSLEDRLLCKSNSKPLNWTQRHSIATGSARGIQYLHTLNEKPIIHGDIKSANILLDPYLVPKIGDFGLAREGPLQKYSHVKVSRVHGTKPYLPDEFLRGRRSSTKVDTYSFGVVLFELATGSRAYDNNQEEKFLKKRIESIPIEKLHEFMDVKAGPDDGVTFISLINLGKLCVSQRPKDRPEMVEVLHKLQSAIKPQIALPDQPVRPRISIETVNPQSPPPRSNQMSPTYLNNASPTYLNNASPTYLNNPSPTPNNQPSPTHSSLPPSPIPQDEILDGGLPLISALGITTNDPLSTPADS